MPNIKKLIVLVIDLLFILQTFIVPYVISAGW